MASFLWVTGDVAGHVSVSGHVEGDLVVGGDSTGGVDGDLIVRADVDGDLTVARGVEGNLFVWRDVKGSFSVIKRVGKVLDFTGSAETVELRGEFVGPVFLQPDAGGSDEASADGTRLKLVKAARFGDEVVIGENINIETAEFDNCTGLENFRFIGSYDYSFPRHEGVLPPWEHATDKTEGSNDKPTGEKAVREWNELAVVNRRFRVAVESQHNRPAASMFYKAEMDARRQAAWHEGGKRRVEWFVLKGYQWMSGYGTQAWRALLWFLLLGVIGAFVLYGKARIWNIDLSDWYHWLLFTLQTMISFFDPPGTPKEVEFNSVQETVRLALRFAGPVLFAQFIFAVRDRVAR